MTVRVVTGSTRCQAVLSHPAGLLASTEGSINPPDGKIPGRGPIPVEKTMSRIMPNQNSGME